MSKERSKFADLSEHDRKFILDLCATHSYDDVVELLKRSRADGGLELTTSSSALCRFYTRHRDPAHALLAQSAAAMNICHQQDAGAFLGAITASVQARLFENLTRGKALADLQVDFKLLKTAQNLYLTDAQWRAENPKAARASYQAQVDLCAREPDYDFLTRDEFTKHPEVLVNLRDAYMSEFERDVIQSRERQERDAEHRSRILAALQGSLTNPNTSAATQLPSAEHYTRTPHSFTPAIGTALPAKTPVIPPIPPDSTCANTPPATAQAEPTATQKPPRTPLIRIAPKIGRNDPCPCGSGHKYKKCCLAKPNHALAA